MPQQIEIICQIYVLFIILLAGKGSTDGTEYNKNSKQFERIKRNVAIVNDRTFKKMVVYSNAITTLSTYYWPRYVNEKIHAVKETFRKLAS